MVACIRGGRHRVVGNLEQGEGTEDTGSNTVDGIIVVPKIKVTE